MLKKRLDIYHIGCKGEFVKIDKQRNLIEWALMLVVVFIMLFFLDMPAAERAAGSDMTTTTHAPAEVRSVEFAGVWRVVVVSKVSGAPAGPTVYWVLPFVHVIVDKA